MKAYPTIVRVLVEAMRTARQFDVSFNACMQQARRQFNQEVRESAERQPLNES